ncbi:MAG: SPASM domain-containing protein [Actinobacteria bacterium]|nr:MAG: SPASM domain-containing protein [Actinomycetota bacterium]
MYCSRYISTFDIDDATSLLVNALTGAVDIAPSSVVRQMREHPSSLPSDTLAQLHERGYLVSSPDEERRRLEDTASLARSIRSRNRPREYCICPTFHCNLACTYCFERDIDKKPHVMGEEEIAALFVAIDRLAEEEEQPPNLQLFGGEPLMRATRGAVEEILAGAQLRGLQTMVVTNGVSVVEFADVIRRFASGLKAFQITIDGPPEIHNERRKSPGKNGAGTFDDMARGVDFLLGEGLNVALRINVDRHNIDHLPDLAGIIVDRGWHGRENFRTTIAPVQTHCNDTTYPHYMREDEIVARVTQMFADEPGTEEVLNFDSHRLLKRIAAALGLGPGSYAGPNFHYCEACLLEVYVFGSDGLIYPCSEAIGNEQLSIGAFYPALEMYEKRKAQWEDRSALKMPECRECSIVSFCAGGCAYAAIRVNGDICKPVCGEAKDVLAAYVRHVAPRIREAFDAKVSRREPDVVSAQ